MQVISESAFLYPARQAADVDNVYRDLGAEARRANTHTHTLSLRIQTHTEERKEER